MHLFLAAEGSLEPLRAELVRRWPTQPITAPADRWLGVEAATGDDTALPPVAFARQALPRARSVAAGSIRKWADLLFEALLALPTEPPAWRLQITPHFGQGTAGAHRCELIREALDERLQRQRRQLLRRRSDATTPFTPEETLLQLALTAPDAGFLAVSAGPLPHDHRAVLSPFPGGEVPVAVDKAAPCRAFAKLVEAEQRLGRRIAPGETCVDLGASPGSWTYVALQRGARVTAVDRSPLRPDLMRDRRLTFHQGDAFAFAPAAPVDWLLCDVIAAPARSIALVHAWVGGRRCRHFVVTLKFKGATEYALLDEFAATLPSLAEPWLLTRMCANKNEVCVLGSLQPGPGGSPVPTR